MNRSSIIRVASLAGLTLLATTLSQCKKSSSSNGGSGNSGGYYLKFNLNGAPVDYESEAAAELNKVNSDGLYSAVLEAYKDFTIGSVTNEITITLFSANPIAATTYEDPHKADETNGSQVPQAEVFWEDSTATGYLTAGALADSNGNIPIAGMVANAQVTITELTSNDLKGTFSGTLYNSTNFTIVESITDGEFYLKRTQ
jgi:hypothetical protein